jgi:nucleotide-binding universal stress UspA family protein
MKILFATDGSDSALAALEFLLRFPVPEGSELLITMVIEQAAFSERLRQRIAGVVAEDRPDPVRAAEPDSAHAEGDKPPALSEAQVRLCQDARDHLQGVVARLRAADWSTATEVREGQPVDQICQAAEALAADLILVGTRGLGGLSGYLLGSVSAGVLQNAPCSVLLVPPPDLTNHALPDAAAPLRFLLAHDGSRSAEKAVELCARLPLKGRATVTLLRVMELVTLYRQDLSQCLSPAFQEEERAAKQALGAAAERLRSLTPEVQTKLLQSDDPAQSILATAAEEHSDLILLGHKGRSAVERLLLGSVVGRIAARAECALLVVR